MKPVSVRTREIAPSMTVAVDTLAKRLKAEGRDIVSLGAGEPDFETPAHICEAGIEAIRQGKTRYVAPVGLLEVREAVAKKLEAENGLHYDASQIVLTSGAKHAVFNAFAALLNPGDEVVIPAPYWVTYPELVRWFGAVPVIVNSSPEAAFKISAAALEGAITAKTKAVVLNNPCNPSGALYSKGELEELCKVMVGHDLYCVSDEIYEHFCYGGEFASAAGFEGMQERTILINGLSKSHCMTGWRLGYDAATEELAQMIAKIQSQAIHHPSLPAQYGALAALTAGNECVFKMRDVFKGRRDFLRQKISATLGTEIPAPEGAFYLFAPVKKLYGKLAPSGQKIDGSIAFCNYLLEAVGLAIVPGAAFGMDTCVRFSYAASEATLAEAAKRFDSGVRALK